MTTNKSTALKNSQATLSWTRSESSSFIRLMKTPIDAQKIGAAIRTARKQHGYVMRQVADAAGVTAGAVGNWERGANDMSVENLRAVARFLKLDPVALSDGKISYVDGTDPSALADAEIVTELGPPPSGPMDVEILGIAVGGDDGDFSLNGEVTGYVRRPPGIAHLKRVFALHIVSDSMSPRYEPGELIYCGGREAVGGDHVVIEMYPDKDEVVGKAYVKKLIRRSKGNVICEQYNPRIEVSFDAYRVKNLWRIIPLIELVGY